jgi:hypothetical protein
MRGAESRYAAVGARTQRYAAVSIRCRWGSSTRTAVGGCWVPFTCKQRCNCAQCGQRAPVGRAIRKLTVGRPAEVPKRGRAGWACASWEDSGEGLDGGWAHVVLEVSAPARCYRGTNTCLRYKIVARDTASVTLLSLSECPEKSSLDIKVFAHQPGAATFSESTGQPGQFKLHQVVPAGLRPPNRTTRTYIEKNFSKCAMFRSPRFFFNM